jgi:hypothetical protein
MDLSEESISGGTPRLSINIPKQSSMDSDAPSPYNLAVGGGLHGYLGAAGLSGSGQEQAAAAAAGMGSGGYSPVPTAEEVVQLLFHSPQLAGDTSKLHKLLSYHAASDSAAAAAVAALGKRSSSSGGKGSGSGGDGANGGVLVPPTFSTAAAASAAAAPPQPGLAWQPQQAVQSTAITRPTASGFGAGGSGAWGSIGSGGGGFGSGFGIGGGGLGDGAFGSTRSLGSSPSLSAASSADVSPLLFTPGSFAGSGGSSAGSLAAGDLTAGASATAAAAAAAAAAASAASASSSPSAAALALALTGTGPFEPARYSCLGCALEDLRRVDSLLSLAVDFWSNMELLIDHLLRSKEASETLLIGGIDVEASRSGGSGSGSGSGGSSVGPELSSLTEYASFWRVLAYLCEKYIQTSKADVAELFGWLSEPQALA